MTTLVGLALGASVVYRRPTDEVERAAIVVDIGDGTGRNVTLLILGLPTEGLSYAHYAVFDDRPDHAGGTWRWPLESQQQPGRLSIMVHSDTDPQATAQAVRAELIRIGRRGDGGVLKGD